MAGGFRRWAVLVLLVLLASGCSGPGPRVAAPTPPPAGGATPSPAAVGATPSPGGRLSHVVVLVMENKEYSDIIGNPSAPYINALARSWGLATRYYAVSHPSLPNYLALTGGSTFGITSDCTDCSVAGPSLATQLAAAGIPWGAYLAAMPSACFTGGSAGAYAKKHNPFAYYDEVARDPALCSHLVPGASLVADATVGRLPAVTWVSPDLCSDMHDCSVATGDSYLAGLVPVLLAALGSRGLLVVTWDEGTSNAGCCGVAAGGHVATILAGTAARPGATSSVAYDHYSVLRTIEDAFGLPELGQAACPCTAAMTDLLVPSP